MPAFIFYVQSNISFIGGFIFHFYINLGIGEALIQRTS